MNSLFRINKRYSVFLLFLLLFSGTTYSQAVFTMNVNEKSGTNHQFWKAAGHDDMFLLTKKNSDAGNYILSRIKEHQSIVYARVHCTFSDEHRGGKVIVRHADGTYDYDFSIVNSTFQQYVAHGMKPIVEFDFFPDGFAKPLGGGENSEGFDSRNAEPKDWNEWEKLMRAFMENLIAEFGKDEMRTWYYEVWNEPDGWPTKHIHVFYRLYDTFAHVVKSYDEGFRVGGPAMYSVHALKPFLDHVTSGTNFVTGQKGSPIDFISHHIYGLSGSWLNSSPEIFPQVSRFSQELLWLQRLIEKYNELENTEFHLNEWGLSSHYFKPVKEFPRLVYRNNEISPLFMVKLVDCLYAIEDEFNFKTSLMLYWGFSMEDEMNVMFAGHRELTTGGHTPKPILTGYEFLSKLQADRLKVDGNLPGSRLGIIPTVGNEKMAFIVYNFNETDDDLSVQDLVNVNIDGLTADAKLNCKVYVLDREQNNTYAMWLKAGAPATPDKLPSSWFESANRHEYTDKIISSDESGKVSFELSLPRHSMQLFIIDMK